MCFNAGASSGVVSLFFFDGSMVCGDKNEDPELRLDTANAPPKDPCIDGGVGTTGASSTESNVESYSLSSSPFTNHFEYDWFLKKMNCERGIESVSPRAGANNLLNSFRSNTHYYFLGGW